MAKVTITIDDRDAGIVALFGENAADVLADALSYPPIVAIPKDELPNQIEVVETDPTTGEETRYLTYPEGTVFDKPNTEPKPLYLGRKVYTEAVIPMLLSYFERKIKTEKDAEVKAAMDQAKSILVNAGEIKAE